MSTQTADLHAIIDQTANLFLDFDGPICHIFARLPDRAVADELRAFAERHGLLLTGTVAENSDPLAVFRAIGDARPDLILEAEATLRAAETRAVATAEPTPYAVDVMAACRETDRIAVIVSNNSRTAIQTYLDAHDLAWYVKHIEGRTNPDPALMKPDPYPVRTAMSMFAAMPMATTLVGDSVTDIQAARAAGVHSIGFANKPGKRETLMAAGAEVVIDTMAHLAAALRASLIPPG
jgi:phosphoglycolate phosphatase-like HAD superfamily hydrolase